MNKEQAKEEYIKIIKEVNKKQDAIIKKAKEDGKWMAGLDSNKSLFKEINEKAKLELAELESQIYEMKKVTK